MKEIGGLHKFMLFSPQYSRGKRVERDEIGDLFTGWFLSVSVMGSKEKIYFHHIRPDDSILIIALMKEPMSDLHLRVNWCQIELFEIRF